MKYTTTAILITGAIIFATALFTSMAADKPQFSAEIETAFKIWKAKHGKEYSSPEEHLYRLGIFQKSVLKIKEDEGKFTYKMALNKFSDMTIEEIKTKHFGYKRRTKLTNPENIVDESYFGNKKLPTNWDWRDHGAVTGVKDQGNCGSCWAFSTTGSIEGLYAITKGEVQSFSEQYLVDCDTADGNAGCDGGEMTDALEYIANNGIPLEKDYPYHARDRKCKHVQSFWQTDGWKQLRRHKAAALQAAVYQQPIAIGIEADEIMSYSHGVFNNKKCKSSIDHGVLMVGYGTTSSGQDYWLVKNSWGEDWGDNGYIKFERDMTRKVNVCGILDESEFPTVQGR